MIKKNPKYVHWETSIMLWELLQRGVRVYYEPPPFVHTRLFLVDDYYTQICSICIHINSPAPPV